MYLLYNMILKVNSPMILAKFSIILWIKNAYAFLVVWYLKNVYAFSIYDFLRKLKHCWNIILLIFCWNKERLIFETLSWEIHFELNAILLEICHMVICSTSHASKILNLLFTKKDKIILQMRKKVHDVYVSGIVDQIV